MSRIIGTLFTVPLVPDSLQCWPSLGADSTYCVQMAIQYPCSFVDCFTTPASAKLEHNTVDSWSGPHIKHCVTRLSAAIGVSGHVSHHKWTTCQQTCCTEIASTTKKYMHEVRTQHECHEEAITPTSTKNTFRNTPLYVTELQPCD